MFQFDLISINLHNYDNNFENININVFTFYSHFIPTFSLKTPNYSNSTLRIFCMRLVSLRSAMLELVLHCCSVYNQMLIS